MLKLGHQPNLRILNLKLGICSCLMFNLKLGCYFCRILYLESITGYGICIESWIYQQLWNLYWILNLARVMGSILDLEFITSRNLNSLSGELVTFLCAHFHNYDLGSWTCQFKFLAWTCHIGCAQVQNPDPEFWTCQYLDLIDLLWVS